MARDIIRWMDEWLSDREHGGFYASQDADYSMDDDGDYFTWTLDEARAVLDAGGIRGRALRLRHRRSRRDAPQSREERSVREELDSEEIASGRAYEKERRCQLCSSPPKTKMYAARLTRPTPVHRQDCLCELERAC